MGKQAKPQPESRGSQSSATAIKPTAYKKLVEAVASANGTMEKGRKNKAELIRDAVDSDNLHAGAFGWMMKLRKMDPVKRNEWLFHFELYCEREQFAREDLLSDRGGHDGGSEEEPEAPPAGGASASSEDEKDLRPRHLRQPGASAAEDAVSKIQNDALNKVGRGTPPDKMN